MSGVRVASLMEKVEADVRSKVRRRLVEHGPAAYQDEQVFQRVHALLQRAADGRDRTALMLPDVLSDEDDWVLDTNLRLSSHRLAAGRAILFVKRRILLPLTRWLFEYSQENFRRQQHVNLILMACVEELAIENARLRRDLDALASRR
jgi:hypothetical protein